MLQSKKENWHIKFNGSVTTLWVRAYLKALGRGLRVYGVAETKQILNSIERHAKAYFDEDTHRPDYDTTALVSAQCSVVLAAYRNLESLFGNKDAAIALVNEAMVRAPVAPKIGTQELQRFLVSAVGGLPHWLSGR